MPLSNKAKLPPLAGGEGKVQHLLQEPSKESGQLVLKRYKVPQSLQRQAFKDRVKEVGSEVCRQLTDIHLICWWRDDQESASSTFWFQPVWGLCAYGQHTVTFSHLVGGFSSCRTAQRTWLRILSIAPEEELKALGFV